jgi:hypothetical protein
MEQESYLDEDKHHDAANQQHQYDTYFAAQSSSTFTIGEDSMLSDFFFVHDEATNAKFAPQRPTTKKSAHHSDNSEDITCFLQNNSSMTMNTSNSTIISDTTSMENGSTNSNYCCSHKNLDNTAIMMLIASSSSLVSDDYNLLEDEECDLVYTSADDATILFDLSELIQNAQIIDDKTRDAAGAPKNYYAEDDDDSTYAADSVLEP